MTPLPKPKHCEQDWLDMSPTEGGRICKECTKTIIDFSKMSWSEIEKVQKANDNSACGMYTTKQLNYWGQEVPKTSCTKLVATTALIASLTMSVNLFSQTINANDTTNHTIIHGNITGKSKKGEIDTLGFTQVQLKGTEFGVLADEHGNYTLDLTNYIDTIQNPTIVFSMLGYNNLELILVRGNRGDKQCNLQLNKSESTNSIIYYYVKRPTLRQRLNRLFRNWF